MRVETQRTERDDARIEPRIADVGNARQYRAGGLTLDLHFVDPRFVRSVSLELIPAFDGSRLQFRERPDDFEIGGVGGIDPDR